MKNLFMLSLLGLSFFSFANDNQALMNKTYEKAYANAAINCEYFYWRAVPKIITLNQNYSKESGADALYRVNDNIIAVKIVAGGSNGVVSFKVNGESFNGSIKSRGGANAINHIELDLTQLTPTQSLLASQVQLSDMDCSVDIGMENHFKLTEEQVHINMHPHRNYDVDGESIPGTLRELAKPSQQLMLFDDAPNNRFKALGTNFNNFVNNGINGLRTPPFSTPDFDIPKTIPMRLSQAGHNRFTLTKPHHEITYSGGNHNFCILNNTRRVLHGFMENPDAASITFKFPLDAIVVQKKSWLRDGSFPRQALKNSNMLSKVFPVMSAADVKKYLDGYYSYFRYDYLGEKKHYFATATFRQVLKGTYERVETVEGLGSGHLDITFEYIK